MPFSAKDKHAIQLLRQRALCGIS